MIEERMQTENGSMEPNQTEIDVWVKTEITVEERLIIDKLNTLMISNETEEYQHFKKVDQRKLRDATQKVNAVIRHTETDDVTQTNKLTMAAALWVARVIGVKKGKRAEKKGPWWKRRIERETTNRRRDITRLEREKWGETRVKGKRKIKKLNAKYKAKKRE